MSMDADKFSETGVGRDEHHQIDPIETTTTTEQNDANPISNITNEATIDEKDDDEGRPSKRQRLTDTLTPQRSSSSRAPSPPWRKPGAEGPTTFTVDGKRKSARTNTLPLELVPTGDKRATRASISHTPNVKSKYSSSRRDNTSTPGSLPKTAPPRTGISRSLSISNATKPSPLKQSPSKKLSNGHKSAQKTGDVQRPRSEAQNVSSPSGVELPASRHRRKTLKAKEDWLTNGTGRTGHDHSQVILDDAGESTAEEDVMDVTPITPGSNQKAPRLRLKFNMAAPKAQHPLHIPPDRKYKSFKEWFETEGAILEGETASLMTQEEIEAEAEFRRRIEEAARPGGLLSQAQPRLQETEVEEQQGPQRQYTRHDFTVAHAIRFRTLLDRERRKHIGNARKYAYEAQVKWKASQPKSISEIESEHHDHFQAVTMATMKQCILDLKTKWDIFRREVYLWRVERWKEEQDALGKENLKRVIEESEALLDPRLLEVSDVSESEESVSISEASDSDDHGDVEDNMSSESSDSEDESARNSDDDLSPEALAEKYKTAVNASKQPSYHSAPDDIQMEEVSDAEQNAPDEEDTIMKGLDFEDEDIKAKIAQAQQDDSKADLSEDESTDMDSESDMDSDDDSEDDSEDGSEEEDVGLAALLGGFGGSKIAKPKGPLVENDDKAPTPAIIHDAGVSAEDDTAHLIPDAAQVQTPVSNSEAPIALRKDHDGSPDGKASGLRIAVTTDTNAMDVDQADEEIIREDHVSMPATPVSVDLDKKQIPSLEVPHLLRATLRDYQKDGFSWLADRYDHGANSILADEMGLGKTIQTITLLAHLALNRQVWGPHLIVVPTSVILNWEMEFKKFLPSFKVLSYYGTPEERKRKRLGWLDDDQWNVVITSYQLVVADKHSFKRRGWQCLVLDEAHNIKNFRSERWQTLLNFRTHSRLLLTGTPLQNNLEELWSLLFFLIGKDKAEDFLGRQEFALLFKKPADQILEDDQQHLDAEAQEQVNKLHQILRPRLLRRLKADVEKQMPGKYEHVVYCRLSKRQRYLYDGFLSRSATRETLASGNYLSIINCLMKLRQVCNHPDLFETRPIVTSFAMPRSVAAGYAEKDTLIQRLCFNDPYKIVNLDVVDLLPGSNGPVSALDTIQKSRLVALFRLRELVWYQTEHGQIKKGATLDGFSATTALRGMENKSKTAVLGDLQQRVYLTSLRSQSRPLYSHSLAKRLLVPLKSFPKSPKPKNPAARLDWLTSQSPVFEDMVKTLDRRAELMQDYLIKFTCTTPAVVAPDLFELTFGKRGTSQLREVKTSYKKDVFQEASIRQSIAFPDKRLLQYDCGKLQKLDALLRKLQAGGHRALIFTQMIKVLDILEQFLNIHGHRYLRLDGATKLESRQLLTERFNTDPSILAFILSSRSGGIGINLTGADTVIFYDLDWNPAMDKQCQDRAHRIGQTRDVHIYRFVSEHTIEANILRKSNQKRLLDDVIIHQGDFTTDYFNKPATAREIFDDPELQDADAEASAAFDRVLGVGNANDSTTAKMLGQVEDKEDVAAARLAEKEIENADEADFDDKTLSSNKNTRPSSRQGLHGSDGNGGNASQDTSQTNAWITGEISPRTDMAIDIFKEKQSIGVDRHIVESLEWEGKDIPFVPLDLKKKKRRDDHRIRRR